MASYEPIWKDVYFQCQSGTFSIQQNDGGQWVTIYSGRAVVRPGASGPVRTTPVYINSIISDYLVRPALPDFTELGTSNFEEQSLVSSFRCYDGSTQRSERTFMNDWSYDYTYDYSTEDKGLCFPINGRLAKGQYLIASVVGAVFLSVEITDNDGSTQALDLAGTSGDFNSDFNKDFLRFSQAASGKTGIVTVDLSKYPNARRVVLQVKTAGGTELYTEYEVSDTCGRYVLYYLNAYGGWDSLYVEGLANESDQLTRHTSRRDYRNTSAYTRGTFNYSNEIVKQWMMHTGWLDDSAAGRMHHLLNSTDVYLMDMNTRLTYPVVLTDTQTEYKTYRANGRQPVNYELTVQLAQDRQRR